MSTARIIAMIGSFACAAASLVAPAWAHDAGQASGENALAADVFAFQPAIVLDLRRGGVINSIPGRAHPLEDCSGPDDFCLRSSELHVRFPRRCFERRPFPRDGRGGGMKVVGTFERRIPHGFEHTHVLLHEQFPLYAFAVSRRGLVAIFYRPGGDIGDFLTGESLARAAIGATDVGFTYNRLSSMAPLGRCDPSALPG